jgi:hypothetical protein
VTRVTDGRRHRLLVKDAGADGRVITVETIDMARPEAKSLFDADFWLECEREADLMLRAITGAADQ